MTYIIHTKYDPLLCYSFFFLDLIKTVTIKAAVIPNTKYLIPKAEELSTAVEAVETVVFAAIAFSEIKTQIIVINNDNLVFKSTPPS